MIYEGNLYGKIGQKYFDTGKTSEDWDRLVNAIKLVIPCLDTDKDLTDSEILGTSTELIKRRTALRICQTALLSINIKS